MIAGIPDYIIVMVIAMTGVLYRQVMGFYKAKQANPGLTFDPHYIDATVVAMIGTAAIYATTDIQLSAGIVLAALASGMGIQEITVQVAKITRTPGKNE